MLDRFDREAIREAKALSDARRGPHRRSTRSQRRRHVRQSATCEYAKTDKGWNELVRKASQREVR
jgi:hypothetical protein